MWCLSMASGKTYLDRFLFEDRDECSPIGLAIYRILYSTCILIGYLPHTSGFPPFPVPFSILTLSPTAIFTQFPPRSFFIILNGLLVLATCSLLAGYRTRLASTSLALLLLVGNAWAYSFGTLTKTFLWCLYHSSSSFLDGETRCRSTSGVRARTYPTNPGSDSWPLALLAILSASLCSRPPWRRQPRDGWTLGLTPCWDIYYELPSWRGARIG